MINVIVTYQIKKDFVEQNKKNIETFLHDFKKLDTNSFSYKVYTKDDGVTFVHFSSYKNETIQKDILNVSSFKKFQKIRDESGLNNSHKVEVLTFVAGSD